MLSAPPNGVPVSLEAAVDQPFDAGKQDPAEAGSAAGTSSLASMRPDQPARFTTHTHTHTGTSQG